MPCTADVTSEPDTAHFLAVPLSLILEDVLFLTEFAIQFIFSVCSGKGKK